MPPLFDSLRFFLDREPHCAALNMAIDEVVLGELPGPVLRAYAWALPAVSFGYFEKFESVRAAFPSRDLVRRWTGGGVVPHGSDFTYSLLVPKASPLLRLPVSETYRLIHKAVAFALNANGIHATIAATATEKISQACFENPVRHDLLAHGRKIGGAAQRRTRFGLLHQGSVQTPVSSEFATTLAAALSNDVVTWELAPRSRKEAEDLASAKYDTAAWNERV